MSVENALSTDSLILDPCGVFNKLHPFPSNQATTILPRDVQAELRVGGNCIRYPEQFDKLGISYADCFDERAAALLKVMGSLRSEGIPVNHPGELNDRLLTHRVFDGNVEALRAFLIEISEQGSIRSGFDHDCERIAAASLKRKIFDVGDWMRYESLNGKDPLEIMSDAQAAIMDLRESGRGRSHFKLITARELADMD